MKIKNRVVFWVMFNFYKFFYEYVAAPWLFAKLHVAWEEYQKDRNYIERAKVMGFQYVLDSFFNDRIARRYLYSEAIRKNPKLKWQVWLLPWSIPLPAVLETAIAEGFFAENKEERRC